MGRPTRDVSLKWALQWQRAKLVRVALAFTCAAATGLHAATNPLEPPANVSPLEPATRAAPEADPTPAASPPALESARQQADAAYAQAMQALQQQQWLQAELLLERALMFYPEHAEAMLQLALLLAQRDDPDSAKALIQVLLDDPTTPPEHRWRLRALLGSAHALSALDTSQTTEVRLLPRTVVKWELGYSDNPLAATRATELVLTLPESEITVPLQPRRSQGAIAQLQLYHRWTDGWELQAATQASSATDARAAGRFTLVGPTGLGGHTPIHWTLSAQRALDGARRHAASLLWQAPSNPPAQPGSTPGLPLVIGLGWFEEPQSGRRGWTVRAQKAWPTAPTIDQQGLAWTEYEHAQGAAPSAVRAGWQGQWLLAPQWRLHASASIQADTDGYSPLLANNKSRRLLTGALTLERLLATPIAGGQLAIGLHGSQRWSNLPLFAWKDYGLSLQWQRQWR